MLAQEIVVVADEDIYVLWLKRFLIEMISNN